MITAEEREWLSELETLLPGLRWCGGCGSGTRLITEPEARRIARLLCSQAAAGTSVLPLFTALGLLLETHARAKLCGPCTCEIAEPAVPRSGFYLYRLWTTGGRLLYVGVSTALPARLRTHARRWGELIERVTWDEHPDAASMLAAERRAIQDEAPALNKAGS